MLLIKKLMLQENNFLTTKRMFWIFLLVSFLLWLIPFIIRLFFIDFVEIKKPSSVNSFDIVGEITAHALKNDSWTVFCLIFINNLKVTVINIIGGMLLGLGTVSNLIINGFLAADTFAAIHKNGMPIGEILKHTLPHSFELVGIWLSGAIGFSIAKVIVDFMRGKELPNVDYFRFIGRCIIITVLIILLAAFVESYVSMSLIK